ncbi:hypothetical protein IWQ60_010576 [Tieghemiomyces parasiticus]|uniref:SAP domain-containing protein n=1 Tax=Tieghemiomyces parasiticus TaxID=78921 RepID=A0A9W8DMK8_9FUNG|nr:hypothetical protein IWQ60_010576 [Tieghemiomyces parasiticus]
MNASKLNTLKVQELKEECDRLGLPKTGKKEELKARILAHLKPQGAAQPSAAKKAKASPPAASAPQQPPTPSAPQQPPVSEEPMSEDGPSFIPSSPTLSSAHSSAVAAPATTSDSGNTTAVAVNPAEDPEEERRRKRAAKFGIPYKPAEPVKVSKPAANPKTTHAITTSADKLGVDAETLRKRAERFGLPTNVAVRNAHPAPAVVDSEEEERRRKRAERFGAPPKPKATQAK